MAGKRQAFTQSQQQEILEALLETKTKQEYRRLVILLAMTTSDRSLSVIAREFGVSESMVNHLACAYRKDGLLGIASRPKGGNHRNMSLDEETRLLESFRRRLDEGESVDVAKIQSAYEQKLGRPVSRSVIYYMLSRHHWKKKGQTDRETVGKENQNE